jgi:hypothetical protein
MWIDEFERPMGAPLAPATLTKAGVYSRKFKNGAVTFDTRNNTGHFGWV